MSLFKNNIMLTQTSGDTFIEQVYTPYADVCKILAGVCFCSLLVGGFVGYILGTVI